MRSIAISIALALTTVALVVQLGAQPKGGKGTGGPAASKTYISAADVTALMAKARNDRKDQPVIAQTLLDLAPYRASLEYRGSVGQAAVHETEAEMFYVVDGSATLVTGGKLIGETRTGVNLSGSGIEGGSPRPIAKGDFVIVPEGTPHWFSPINGTLVLMSIHLPRPLPAAAK